MAENEVRPGAMAAGNPDDDNVNNDPVKAMRAQREQALRDGDQDLADRLGKTLAEGDKKASTKKASDSK